MMTRIIVDTLEYGDPRIKEASERMKRLIQGAAVRRYRRVVREAVVAGTPGWLGPIEWPFPTWSVRSRPFDWQVDARNERGPDWLDVDRGEQLAAEHGWA